MREAAKAILVKYFDPAHPEYSPKISVVRAYFTSTVARAGLFHHADIIPAIKYLVEEGILDKTEPFKIRHSNRYTGSLQLTEKGVREYQNSVGEGVESQAIAPRQHIASIQR